MEAERSPACPLCDFPLIMPERYCRQCDITLNLCPNCGRYHPPWLSTCPYCHSTIATGRAYEVTDATKPKHPTVAPNTKQVSTPRRMRHLDAAVIAPSADDNDSRDTLEFAADDNQNPEQRHSRIDYLSDDVDTEADAARDALQQVMNEQQFRMDEKINPRWIEYNFAGPGTLFLIALVILGEYYDVDSTLSSLDGMLTFPLILMGIAVMWMILIVLVDRYS